MKYLLLIIQFIGIYHVNAQTHTADRPGSNLDTALTYFKEGDVNSSILFIDKAIKLDSLCSDLYLIRGFFQLWETYRFVESATYEEPAIKDLDIYISMQTSGYFKSCSLNDSLIKEITQGIINYKQPPEVCAVSLSIPASNILKGVIAYTKSDKIGACEHWLKVKNAGYSEIDLLIDKYCIQNEHE